MFKENINRQIRQGGSSLRTSYSHSLRLKEREIRLDNKSRLTFKSTHTRTHAVWWLYWLNPELSGGYTG